MTEEDDDRSWALKAAEMNLTAWADARERRRSPDRAKT